MSNLRRVLERQEQEKEEIQRIRAEDDREADEEEKEMFVATVCMHNQSRQHHRRRAPNVDRRKESRGKNLLEDYFIPVDAFFFRQLYLHQPKQQQLTDKFLAWHGSKIVMSLALKRKLNVPRGKMGILQRGLVEHEEKERKMWLECFFGSLTETLSSVKAACQKGKLRENDGLSMKLLGFGSKRGSLLSNVVDACWVTYKINNTVYSGAYYLADGIYPRWMTFVKTIPNPQFEKEKSFAAFQEGYRKEVERCFGILQARWAIIRGAARMLDEEMLWSIMMTYIILHNMIVEDDYDYDAP
ncbi:unnamed protein product [Prunus brigantina]